MSSPSVIPEKLYTSEEVADLLRVSLRTVQRLLQAGSLHSYRIHGQYRVKGLDLLGYLDGVRRDSEAQSEIDRPGDLLTRLALPPVALEIAPNWARAISPSEEEGSSAFLTQLQSLREKISQDLGFVLPGVQIQDATDLQEGQYRMLIHGQTVARGQLQPEQDYHLCNSASPNAPKPLERLAESYQACEKSPQSLSGTAVLLRHLEGIVRAFAHEILSREEVFVMTEALRKSHPVVVEEILCLDGPQTGKLTIGQLTRILKQLLEENVSIRPLAQICAGLADGLDRGLGGPELHEQVRQGLARAICAPLADEQGVIRVLSLSAESEKALRQAFSRGGAELQTQIRRLQETLLEHLQISRIVLCPADLRRPLFECLSRNFSAWQVISNLEIDRLYWLESAAELVL